MRFSTNLLQWAQIYVKLAEEQLNLPFPPATVAPFDNENVKAYKQFLKDIPTLSWNDIEGKLMEDFYKAPYMNQDEVAKLLIEKAFKETNNLSEAHDKLIDVAHTPDSFWTKIKQKMVEYYLDHVDAYLLEKEYLNIVERISDLPEKYLRKAQNNIVKQIVEFASDDPTESSYEASQKILETMMTKSKKFDQGFLWRLAKHLGPEYYGELVAKIGGKPAHEKDNEIKLPLPNKKETYNVYDLSIVLQHNRFRSKTSYDAHDFHILVKKCDPEAKQYLRRLLYGYHGQGYIGYFMLDENMQPMDQTLKNIAFPPYFFIMWDWQYVDPIRELWLPIFHDFGIVPVVVGA